MHGHAALRERQRDAARADPQLERASIAGEPGQEVDDRIDGGRVEHVRRGLVVARGHALVEVAIAVVHRREPT